MAVLSDDASKALVAEKKLTSLPSFCSLESWSCVHDVTYFDTCFCASVPCQITNHLASHTLTSLLMDWGQPDRVPQFVANSFYSRRDPWGIPIQAHVTITCCKERVWRQIAYLES